MINTSNIIKFAASSFIADETLHCAAEDMLALYQAKVTKESGLLTANRSNKKQIEKQIKKRMEAYVKKINLLSGALSSLSGLFQETEDEDQKRMFDYSVDKLARSLDGFSSDEAMKLYEDKVKTHIFDSIDKIRNKKRTEDEATRIIAAFDNFLTINKLR